jgi:hypothetical protein
VFSILCRPFYHHKLSGASVVRLTLKVRHISKDVRRLVVGIFHGKDPASDTKPDNQLQPWVEETLIRFGPVNHNMDE